MNCIDKITFQTRGEAYDFAATYRRYKMYIYQCSECGKWHLTKHNSLRLKRNTINGEPKIKKHKKPTYKWIYKL